MIAATINQAIRTAKNSLGDLVVQATLRKSTGKTYDTASGKYTHTYAETPIEAVNDKFTAQEMQAEDFVQTDLKILVFNPDNNLTFDSEDAIVFAGTEYAIRRVDPVFVGGFKTIFVLVLRK